MSTHRRIRSSLSSLDDVWDPLPSTRPTSEKDNQPGLGSGSSRKEGMTNEVYGTKHDELRRERRPEQPPSQKRGFFSRILSCTCFEFDDSDPVRRYRSKYEEKYGVQPQMSNTAEPHNPHNRHETTE
ncbi:hypothetical protein CI109_102903 [Kwoniella shandongensis]|uniref:Uncharacterized protein n=1 Tax=Kwoniella shandongensis TaxID=1734106 RepID=A0A5M6CBR5_9TREE|nr:uncharacterized protein CI109_000092 [Kwoniella shandongensis]KAA5531252.1 hypothetical protein CI109_000092 [Kwoniella shandongensis]